MKTYKDLYYSDDFKTCYGFKEKKTNVDKIEFHKDTEIIAEESFLSLEIKNLSFPENLKKIERHAFSGCKIKNIAFPDSLTDIAGDAFEAAVCTIDVLVLPKNLKCVDSALMNFKVKDLYLPKNLTFFNPNFIDNVENYHIDKSNRLFTAQNGDLYDNKKEVLFKKGNNKNKILDVKKIGKFAFASINNSDMILPESVLILDDSAFAFASFKSLTLPDNLIYIGANVFDHLTLTKNKTINIPKNVSSLDINYAIDFDGNFDFSKDNENFCIEEEVVYSPDKKTLYYYPDKKENSVFVMPGTVEKIAKNVFKNKNLKKLTFEDGKDFHLETGTFTKVNLKEVYVDRKISFAPYVFFNLEKVILFKDCGFGSNSFGNFLKLAKMPRQTNVEKGYLLDCKIEYTKSIDELLEESNNFKEINSKSNRSEMYTEI